MVIIIGETTMIWTQEKRWIIYFAIIVMLVTGIPYFIGFWAQGDVWKFSGFVFGVEDGNSYIAKMLSGANGNWLFQTPYTTFPQAGIFAFFPYILLGKLTHPPAQHEQLVALFQIFRFAAGFVDIVATYIFVSLFIKSIPLRRLGTALICLGGGLGWLLVLLGKSDMLGSLPLDFYSPEKFGFLEIYGLPHLAFARACMLLALYIYLTKPYARGALLSGVLLFISSLLQPLITISGIALIATDVVVRGLFLTWKKLRDVDEISLWKRSVNAGLIACMIGAPVVLQMSIATVVDPFTRYWNEQNIILSPNPLHYVFAYILVVPFAVIGILTAIHKWKPKYNLLFVWLLIFPIFSYLPINSQRRLPEGAWVPFVVLALLGFGHLVELGRVRSNRAALIFSPVFLTSLFLFAGGIFAAMRLSQPLFIPQSETLAFNSIPISNSVPPVVLASYTTSNAIPAWIPAKVVAGLGPESVMMAEISPLVEEFYSGRASIQMQRDFLQKMGVSYIYFGPDERVLGNWTPSNELGLKKIYDQDNIQIFRVDSNSYPS